MSIMLVSNELYKKSSKTQKSDAKFVQTTVKYLMAMLEFASNTKTLTVSYLMNHMG